MFVFFQRKRKRHFKTAAIWIWQEYVAEKNMKKQNNLKPNVVPGKSGDFFQISVPSLNTQ